MTKGIKIIGSLLLLSSLAFAEVDFRNAELPEVVKAQVESEIKNHCPRMYKAEYIPITSFFQTKEGGITEYVVSSNERGYAVNDPFWDFDVVVKYYDYQNVIMTTEFISRGDCW